ncbi:MAG TPA: DinB family protein [Longimicrobium sp.]|nr:DinB family protein [Longimicrobium sp.]
MTTPSLASTTPARLLFSDLETEFASTRRVLAQVPEAHADFRPHPKSTPLGQLAAHLAELPRLAELVMTSDELDWTNATYVPTPFTTTAEVLASFDAESARMRTAIDAMTWEDVDSPWVMRAGDKIFVEGRKGPLVRAFGLSHMAHHRAQLGVYLRLLDIPVPSVYGPTADEQ